MTVEELIEVLSYFDPTKEIYIRYIRGDRDGSATTEDYWVREDCITIDEYNNPVIDITDDV